VPPPVPEQLRTQAAWCAKLGSPLYAELLAHAALDCADGGPTARVLAGHEGDRAGSVLPVRLMGSVHRLVLEGRAPELAGAYEARDARAAWPLFRELLDSRPEAVRAGLRRPVQTNEVARCAALLGGFLAVAGSTGLPLRLLELGASAGLNLRWDRYRYEGPGGWAWGEARSPVRLLGAWEAPPPPLPGTVRIDQRRGCDQDPVDPTTEEGQLTLLSYVWPDMTARVALLRAAFAVAAEVPARVDPEAAGDWLARGLATPREDVASVVFHSIVWQYLPRAERDRVAALIEEAGARATARAPLAWLRLEPGGDQAEIRLRQWPGGSERVLGTATFHGREVRWRTG